MSAQVKADRQLDIGPTGPRSDVRRDGDSLAQHIAEPDQRIERITAVFLRFVAAVLALTSLAKLLSLAGGKGILLAADPVLRLPYRWSLLGEALVELTAAAFVLSRSNTRLRLVAVLWLGLAFCAYHVLLWITDPGALCPCLGTLYGRVGINPAVADSVSRFLAASFLLGSAFLLILVRRPRTSRQGASASS